MFESGEVKRAEGGRATVVMRPAGGCAGCNRCAGKNGRELIADNAIGAKAGDIVEADAPTAVLKYKVIEIKDN